MHTARGLQQEQPPPGPICLERLSVGAAARERHVQSLHNIEVESLRTSTLIVSALCSSRHEHSACKQGPALIHPAGPCHQARTCFGASGMYLLAFLHLTSHHTCQKAWRQCTAWFNTCSNMLTSVSLWVLLETGAHSW